MLFRVASDRPGERVLVQMAAGGVGTAVLQLCRSVDDLEVFGTASAAKHDVLRAEGCAHPIDYRATDYAAEVRRLTRGEGVDIVLDPLGGNDWRKGLKLLRPAGRLVAYGFANLAAGSCSARTSAKSSSSPEPAMRGRLKSYGPFPADEVAQRTSPSWTSWVGDSPAARATRWEAR